MPTIPYSATPCMDLGRLVGSGIGAQVLHTGRVVTPGELLAPLQTAETPFRWSWSQVCHLLPTSLASACGRSPGPVGKWGSPKLGDIWRKNRGVSG